MELSESDHWKAHEYNDAHALLCDLLSKSDAAKCNSLSEMILLLHKRLTEKEG